MVLKSLFICELVLVSQGVELTNIFFIMVDSVVYKVLTFIHESERQTRYCFLPSTHVSYRRYLLQ